MTEIDADRRELLERHAERDMPTSPIADALLDVIDETED